MTKGSISNPLKVFLVAEVIVCSAHYFIKNFEVKSD